MPEVAFRKYEGLGNDFVLIDDFNEKLKLDKDSIARLLDRHFGIGGDGLILVLPSASADARMVFYNPDGSEAEMCGNGIRAFAKYLYESGRVPKTSLAIETGAGIKGVELEVDRDSVVAAKVDVGKPTFASKLIPVDVPLPEVVEMPLQVGHEHVNITCISMGNPHCVTFWDDLSVAPVERLGPLMERLAVFPERTNVEFAEVVDDEIIELRVWERGAGETLACGTGASAAAVAAARTGRTSRRVTVSLPGGKLLIEWSEKGNVFMTGPANEVFRGTASLDFAVTT